MAKKYLFADESGNFDFRCHEQFTGPTKYFAVGTLMIVGQDNMKALQQDLFDLRYTLAQNGTPHHEPFHATTDPQHVRNAVFDVLKDHAFLVDVTILEKAKALPRLRVTDPQFYKVAWYYHFKWFADRYFQGDDELMVVSAGLGTKRTKKAFRASIEDVVSQCAPYTVNRRFGHWDSATDPCLQAADYVLWAVMRDVERGDNRSRELIKDKVSSVYDLWRVGNLYHYGPKAAKSA